MDKKPVVPQAVMEYYEFYKDTLTSFAEWFQNDLEESPSYFEKEEEVQEWLYDVDYETQKQRELALATLIVNGPEAVEVEKEKLYTAFQIATEEYLYTNVVGKLSSAHVSYAFVEESKKYHFTQQKLEELKYWKNPAFEIKEVKK